MKQSCDNDRDITAVRLQDMIEGFFNRWYATWAFAIGGNDGALSYYYSVAAANQDRELNSTIC